MNKSWTEAVRGLLNDSCLSQGDFHSGGLSLSEKLNLHDFNYNSYSIIVNGLNPGVSVVRIV